MSGCTTRSIHRPKTFGTARRVGIIMGLVQRIAALERAVKALEQPVPAPGYEWAPPYNLSPEPSTQVMCECGHPRHEHLENGGSCTTIPWERGCYCPKFREKTPAPAKEEPLVETGTVEDLRRWVDTGNPEEAPSTDTCTCGHRRVEHKDGYCLHGVPDEGCPCTRYELRGRLPQEGLDLRIPPEYELPESPGAKCSCGHGLAYHSSTRCLAYTGGARCPCTVRDYGAAQLPEDETPLVTCPRCLRAGARTRKHNPDWALCTHCNWDFLKPPRRRNVSPPCACGHEQEFHFEKGPCSGIADNEPCACRLYRPPSDPVEPTKSEAPPDGPGYTPAELFAELDRVVSGPPEVVECAKSWRAMNRLLSLLWVEAHDYRGWSVISVSVLGMSIHRDVFGTEGK